MWFEIFYAHLKNIWRFSWNCPKTEKGLYKNSHSYKLLTGTTCSIFNILVQKFACRPKIWIYKSSNKIGKLYVQFSNLVEWRVFIIQNILYWNNGKWSRGQLAQWWSVRFVKFLLTRGQWFESRRGSLFSDAIYFSRNFLH